ncbi:hypothetical protein V491_08969, partial [Pseudogymnoascus sp. VKM F-3775]
MKKILAASDVGAMAAALNEQRDSMLENPSGNGAILGRDLGLGFSIILKNDASNAPLPVTLDLGTQLVALITFPPEHGDIFIGGVEFVGKQGTAPISIQMLQSNTADCLQNPPLSRCHLTLQYDQEGPTSIKLDLKQMSGFTGAQSSFKLFYAESQEVLSDKLESIDGGTPLGALLATASSSSGSSPSSDPSNETQASYSNPSSTGFGPSLTLS